MPCTSETTFQSSIYTQKQNKRKTNNKWSKLSDHYKNKNENNSSSWKWLKKRVKIDLAADCGYLWKIVPALSYRAYT